MAGVSESVYQQLQKTGLIDLLGEENVYRATSIFGDSAINAYQDATKWLGERENETGKLDRSAVIDPGIIGQKFASIFNQAYFGRWYFLFFG